MKEVSIETFSSDERIPRCLFWTASKEQDKDTSYPVCQITPHDNMSTPESKVSRASWNEGSKNLEEDSRSK